MTDWDTINETVRNAMDAMDKTHAAREALKKQATSENMDAFRAEMANLYEHLGELKNILEHESVYYEDEMVDAISKVLNGHPSGYRAIPHIEEHRQSS